jgi:mRNA interferase MazF
MTRRGELYVVDYGDPLGSEADAQRPSVVVSIDELNRRVETRIVVPLYSDSAPYFHNVEIVPSRDNRLAKRWMANAHLLRHVSSVRIRPECLGRVSEGELDELSVALAYVMDTRNPDVPLKFP